MSWALNKFCTSTAKTTITMITVIEIMAVTTTATKHYY